MLMSLVAIGIVLRIKVELDQDNVVYCRKKPGAKGVAE
jgi:hypothetical protein